VTLCRQAANTGFADLSNLNLPAGLQADVCGPVPFIESVRQQLIDRSVPATAMRYERFGLDLGA
jgi:nitric oxide dioxygenase